MATYDCFISYASRYEQLARAVATDLRAHDLTVFLAAYSIGPGERWSESIRNALAASEWVIFIASKDARESPWVQQELGMAIQAKKVVIPVIQDCDPSELPGWVREFQALDLRNMTPQQMQSRVFALGGSLRTQKEQRRKTAWIVASLVAFGLFIGSEDEA
jgi:hypothetical protein